MVSDILPAMSMDMTSFVDDEIEYLEFENLIQEVAERLEASWSYDLDEEVYQIEFVDVEGTLHEVVSVSTEFCEEGFNEGRDLITCEVYLTDYREQHQTALVDVLQLANKLVFTKFYLDQQQKFYLTGKALFHQELAADVITTMVEEMSSLAADFRLKLESRAE